MPSYTLMQHRIAERLNALHRSARDVSLSAGLGPDAIRTIMNGRSRAPRSDTLMKLANELQCEVAYLIGEINQPISTEALVTHEDGHVTGVARLGLHFVAKKKWVESVDPPPGREYEHDGDPYPLSNLYTLQEFLPGFQNLALMADESMNLVVPKGSYVHYLSVGDREARLSDGDIVVFMRQRLKPGDDTISEFECTLRRTTITARGEISLETASSNPELADRVIYEPGKFFMARVTSPDGTKTKTVPGYTFRPDMSEYMDIIGVVLRIITHVSGPKIVPE
ncbi:MAG: hypothetical protein JWP35_4650 [Caulobacter sp.]|nr:hypothetical protein [Caulobacter sp.]